MTAAAASALTSSGLSLSFVLPLPDDFTPQPRQRATRNVGRVSAHRRGKSAAMRVASTAEAGIIAFAPPPGAIGVRTLWAMLLGLFLARLLWSLISIIWS